MTDRLTETIPEVTILIEFASVVKPRKMRANWSALPQRRALRFSCLRLQIRAAISNEVIDEFVLLTGSKPERQKDDE